VGRLRSNLDSHGPHSFIPDAVQFRQVIALNVLLIAREQYAWRALVLLHLLVTYILLLTLEFNL